MALTGVEAIANAARSFRVPRVKRAQRAEVALGVMLIGLSVLTDAVICRLRFRP
ncbi:hypothetical protein [Streptomyces sp. NPDC050988]|uniref:hypothetical protein n=1 Tax=Streptomyces sp. NPDC050988 TaxID=3365637 RepID=UPI0037B0945C